MTLGVFDSGVGGLTVHRALVRAFPTADLIYLADQANAPYGVRGGEEIVALTRAGCERLFALGADLIILACNTAAAIALRRLQQTWLPDYRRGLGRPVNILGLIVPTIEAATGQPWAYEPERRSEKVEVKEVIGIFSTPATAKSRVYEIEVDKRREDVAVFSEPCSNLARLIEAGAAEGELRAVVTQHVRNLIARTGQPLTKAILGCTHYEIVADLFKAALPPGMPLIHQPSAVAESIGRYLARHPEYPPGTSGRRRFLTTGTPAQQNQLVATFWGAPLRFETA
jgi:glutamate racemase